MKMQLKKQHQHQVRHEENSIMYIYM
jgi:hypothetical protein